jgi:GNAT superfamily N-acetyltransferase
MNTTPYGQIRLPEGYAIRLMRERDGAEISSICAAVYPTERPYTDEEIRVHHALFPEGQFVVEHTPSGAVAGAHFTLRLNMIHFHVDDSWDTLTASGSFADHEPEGHTLYGADLFIDPAHQHHGLGRALTEATRGLVRDKGLWRMVGGSRMPGYGRFAGSVDPDEYVARVKRGELVDPVLTAHLHDGWDVITAIRGYLPHDEESCGWAAVIQWLNPASPPPAEFDLARLSRRAPV